MFNCKKSYMYMYRVYMYGDYDIIYVIIYSFYLVCTCILI